jgi:CheY-like chemotaxis protein
MLPELQGFKILVVEDDDDLRDLFKESLEMMGAEVKSARSGNNAIVLCTEFCFDFVISDMIMANGTGLFLATEISKFQKAKPAVFILSGQNDLTDEQCQIACICKVYAKPIKIKEVVLDILQILAVQRAS